MWHNPTTFQNYKFLPPRHFSPVPGIPAIQEYLNLLVPGVRFLYNPGHHRLVNATDSHRLLRFIDRSRAISAMGSWWCLEPCQKGHLASCPHTPAKCWCQCSVSAGVFSYSNWIALESVIYPILLIYWLLSCDVIISVMNVLFLKGNAD